MAFEYTHLTDAQRKQIVEERLQHFEAEHFNHELNKLNLEALPNSKDKKTQLKTANDAQESIERAIEIHRAQLDSLS